MKTIVALATANITCAIHIIRVSGDKCYEIVNKITADKIIKKGYCAQKTFIVDKSKKVIDDVIIIKYVRPKSYTSEDMVEINCHGSPFIVNKIISLLIQNGCALASRGEFTKRSYLNNKINLLQAEGINNLINAKSNVSLAIANKCINKKMTDSLNKIANVLFQIIGQAEVNIDYPEYDAVPLISNTKIISNIKNIINRLNKIIVNSTKIMPYVNGINVAIVGKPNVGKSSLLNAILNKNIAIVSSIPGTTRDMIQYSAIINDITYNFIDTAGIHAPINKIEAIGIKLAKQTIDNADLILFVVDGSKKITNEDNQIFNLIKNKNYLIVNNKIDLKQSKNSYKNTINVSAKNKKIDLLIKSLTKKISDINLNDEIILPSQNDINQMQNSINNLNIVLKGIDKKQSLDLLIQYLHAAHESIINILGKSKNYNFIDELFNNFCVGK